MASHRGDATKLVNDHIDDIFNEEYLRISEPYLVKEILPSHDIVTHLFAGRVINELQREGLRLEKNQYEKNRLIITYSSRTKDFTRCLLLALCEEGQGHIIKEIIESGQREKEVTCPFRHVGCKYTCLNKEDRKKHENDCVQNHLALMFGEFQKVVKEKNEMQKTCCDKSAALDTMRDEVKALQRENDALRNTIASLGQSLDTTNAKLKTLHEENDILKKKAEGFGQSMETVQEVCKLLRGRNDDLCDRLDGSFQPLKDTPSQLEQLRSKTQSLETSMKGLSGKLESLDVEIKDAKSDRTLLKHCTRMSDDTFDWLVEDFSQRSKIDSLGSEVIIYSPIFSSHTKGYQMRILLYPNGVGDGKGSHISVFLQLMRGPHDDQLSWPFTHKYQLGLVNPGGGQDITLSLVPKLDGEEDSWRKPTSEANAGWGWPQFLPLSRLGEYTRQERLIITCRVFR